MADLCTKSTKNMEVYFFYFNVETKTFQRSFQERIQFVMSGKMKFMWAVTLHHTGNTHGHWHVSMLFDALKYKVSNYYKVVQMDFSTPERFDMGNFWHEEFSSRGIFGTWTFRHRDISAPEHFGTWIFWHLAKQYGRFGTDILAPVLLHRNVPVPKCV